MNRFLLLFVLCTPLFGVPTLSEGRIRPLQGDILTSPTLPTKEGWISIAALPEHNPTLYSDELIKKIRDSEDPEELLWQGYRTLEKKSYLIAHKKALAYPSIAQLRVEAWLQKVPLITLALFAYLAAALLLRFSKISFLFLLLGFFLHTLDLAFRCYILGRPPVSNMSETLLYVPWVAVLASLFFPKQQMVRLAASVSAVALLFFTPRFVPLEQVQAVLDSNYWLLIHVLMVVGSYGLFFLAGVLAHLFLLGQKISSSLLLKILYLGTALLICGTLLGGIWAAQSWGRFWDWDPKEAWAFVSSGLYLVLIHAYRYKKIGATGLAMGAIIGLMAISFTWYGVNYILGTGLHSYGFGHGGELYFYLYLIAEALFLLYKKWGIAKKERKK